MTKKAVARDPNDVGARKGMSITAITAEQARRDIARLMTGPEFAATRVIQAVEGNSGYGTQLDTPDLVNCLRALAGKVNEGDLAQVEAMLFNQAVSLQNLFARLVERGMVQEHMSNIEGFMRLALRAQGQSARTLEVLAAIKNPPVVFARQANIAQQQQVNNNAAVPDAREVEKAPTRLLEALPGERLESGTAATTSGAHSQLATVGKDNRPED